MERITVKNYAGLVADFYIRKDTHDELAIDTMFKVNCYLAGDYDIKKGDTVIDIGGHIGIFAVMSALYGANVLTYEPEPYNFSILKANINGYDNIKAFNSMVSSKTGEVDFYLNKNNVAGHSAFIEGEKIKVQSITLQNILQNIKKVDLLKMDCEGSEYEILYSCSLDKIKKIVFEYHGITDGLKLASYLVEQGFNITRFSGGHRLGIVQCRR